MALWGRTASWDILKVQTSCKLAPGTFGARWWDVHRRQPGMSPCPGTSVATSPCLSPQLSPSRTRWRGGKASLTTMRPACEVTEDIATPADCDFLSTTNVVQIDFILWLKIVQGWLLLRLSVTFFTYLFVTVSLTRNHLSCLNVCLLISKRTLHSLCFNTLDLQWCCFERVYIFNLKLGLCETNHRLLGLEVYTQKRTAPNKNSEKML